MRLIFLIVNFLGRRRFCEEKNVVNQSCQVIILLVLVSISTFLTYNHLLRFIVCGPSPPPIIAKEIVKLLEEVHGELLCLLPGLPLDHPGLRADDGEDQDHKDMARDPHDQA